MICVLYRSCLILATATKSFTNYDVVAAIALANGSVEEADNGRGESHPSSTGDLLKADLADRFAVSHSSVHVEVRLRARKSHFRVDNERLFYEGGRGVEETSSSWYYRRERRSRSWQIRCSGSVCIPDARPEVSRSCLWAQRERWAALVDSPSCNTGAENEPQSGDHQEYRSSEAWSREPICNFPPCRSLTVTPFRRTHTYTCAAESRADATREPSAGRVDKRRVALSWHGS